MKIYVCGVNGSGKSTILHELQRKFPEYKVLHVAELLIEWLGFGKDYEKLRSLSPEENYKKLAEFMEYLFAKNYSDGIYIFDSHHLNLVRGDVTSKVGPWIGEYEAMILIWADIETLWNRISKDERDRALFPDGYSETDSKLILSNYQQGYRKVFNELQKTYNLPAIEICNQDNSIDSVVMQIRNFIKPITNMEKIARAIIVNTERILLCKSISGNFYFLPGGHIEKGESGEGALKRELKEEAQRVLEKVQHITDIENSYIQDDVEVKEICYVYIASIDEGDVLSTEDHIAFEWVPIQKISSIDFKPKKLISRMLKTIEENKLFWKK